MELVRAEIPCGALAFAELTSYILGSGKALRFQAHGQSMHPLVRDGDILLVEPVDAGSVRLGDLVLFKNQHERVVVHRVIRRFRDNGCLRFEVKGDRVARPDGTISGRQILGRIASLERDGVYMDMRQPPWSFLNMTVGLISPLNPGQGRAARFMKFCIKRMPVLSRYLT